MIVAIVFLKLLLHQATCSRATASERAYDFELLNGGAVIARENPKTGGPCVVRVPDWLGPEERADPTARYYLYYSTHHGDHIRMKWAPSIEGPWAEYNLGGRFNGRTRRGVFDFRSDVTREQFGHIAMPDVHVDDASQRFIMFYHGENQPQTKTTSGINVPRVHESFVTTSRDGLNFHDPVTSGGQAGYGPQTVTVDGITRDVWIGPAYQRAFHYRNNWYSVSKRAILAKAKSSQYPFRHNANDPFGVAWTIESTPDQIWREDAVQFQGAYYSPAASFLASREFAEHHNNPHPGSRILSKNERINHVSCCVLPDSQLEVFFYVKKDPNDRFNAIYRIVYDIADPDFENWDVARDKSGNVIFDIVLTPEEIRAEVERYHPNAKPMYTVDPISLGDSWIFVDQDNSKYLFYSYVSQRFSGEEGEGQISAVRLVPRPKVQ
ncbi:hypothetical protein [Bremerella volcania]|nr:hypothetical protein [Bremerella volcania]